MNIFAALCHGEPEPFAPGIFTNLERSIYDRIPALSCTMLKKWLSLGEIPSKFAYWMQNRWEQTPTEAFLIGSALDCRMLDDNYSSRFAVAPKVDRRTNAGKAQWVAFEAANAGKAILTIEQGELVQQMAYSLLQAEGLHGVFENCEKTAICAELVGQPCKAEIDLYNPRSIHLFDLKTCRDVSKRWFKRAFIDFGYAEQATFYLTIARAAGLDKTIFDFICVEKEPPWAVKVHSFAPWEKPKHWILFEACQARLAQAAGGLVTRLERDDWRDDQDWEYIEIDEYIVSQAKLETLQAA